MAAMPKTADLHADALTLAKAARRLLNATLGSDLRDNLARVEMRSALGPFEHGPRTGQKGDERGVWAEDGPSR